MKKKKKTKIKTTEENNNIHIRVLVEGLVGESKRKSQLVGRDGLGETTTSDHGSSGKSSATDKRTGQEGHCKSKIELDAMVSIGRASSKL